MKSNKNCIVLVAEGFDENSIVQTTEFFRPSRVNLIFLSLYSSPTTCELAAKYGSSSAAVSLLGDIEHKALPHGLLVAGGLLCGQHLMIDPRFHRLVKEMQLAARPVGFLYPVYLPLIDVVYRLPGNSAYLIQERLQREVFLNNFMYQMSTAFPTHKSHAASLIV